MLGTIFPRPKQLRSLSYVEPFSSVDQQRGRGFKERDICGQSCISEQTGACIIYKGRDGGTKGECMVWCCGYWGWRWRPGGAVAIEDDCAYAKAATVCGGLDWAATAGRAGCDQVREVRERTYADRWVLGKDLGWQCRW